MNNHEYEKMKKKLDTVTLELIKDNEWMESWKIQIGKSFKPKTIDKSLTNIFVKYIYVKD